MAITKYQGFLSPINTTRELSVRVQGHYFSLALFHFVIGTSTSETEQIQAREAAERATNNLSMAVEEWM
jgi:hypothetical protein